MKTILLKNIKAVIFDLDDTLYDHTDFIRGAYGDAAREYEKITGLDAKVFYKKAWSLFLKRSSRDTHIFTDAATQMGKCSKKIEDQLIAAYRSHKPINLKLHDGVMTGIENMEADGLLLGLLTDGNSETQRAKIEALGLSEHMDAIIVTGELGKAFYKPHVEGYIKMMGLLGCTAAETVCVGDDPKTDVAGAMKAGISVIRIKQGQYKDEHSPKGVIEVSNISQVFGMIAGRQRAEVSA